jgi:ABC-type sugar transport system substrate-binding protein
VLKEAKEAEIPVILLDRTSRRLKDLYLTAVTSDRSMKARLPATGW